MKWREERSGSACRDAGGCSQWTEQLGLGEQVTWEVVQKSTLLPRVLPQEPPPASQGSHFSVFLDFLLQLLH